MLGFSSARLRPSVMAAAVVALLVCALGCSSGVAPDGGTPVDGQVLRGPTQPVCRVDVSCSAPFAAGFTVQQDDRAVLRFQSDADGRFSITLAPGTYAIVPDADAPILTPAAQVKALTVPAQSEPVEVEWTFDTGIR
jgi:hypothetical protein